MGCIHTRVFTNFFKSFSTEIKVSEGEIVQGDFSQQDITQRDVTKKETKTFEEQILDTEKVFPKTNFVDFPQDIKTEEPDSKLEFSNVEISKVETGREEGKEEGEWQEV